MKKHLCAFTMRQSLDSRMEKINKKNEGSVNRKE